MHQPPVRYDDGPPPESIVVCEGDSAQWSVGITRQSIEAILKSEAIAPIGDMLALWMFYAYTARWQGTNQPRATVKFVMGGLSWGRDKVRKARQGLLHLKLIEDVHEMDKKTGRLEAAYVKVNHLAKKSSIDAESTPLKTRRVVSTPLKNRRVDLPEGGKSGGKMLKDSKLKCSNDSQRNACQKSVDAMNPPEALDKRHLYFKL